MSSIYFSSDRFDDIYNIYELELSTGVKKQYTNILTGAFSPQERVIYDHKAGEETRQLVFTAYYQGRYRIYRMDRPDEREEFYDVASDNYANVKDYEMTANIELDEKRYREYRPLRNFSLANVDVAAGVTDDGRILSNTAITFSDTLGDHILDVYAYTIDQLENYQVRYIDRSDRLQWGANLQIRQQFFVDFYTNRIVAERLERTYRNVDLGGILAYPISLYDRVTVGAGYTDQDFYQFVPVDGQFTFREVDFQQPYAFVNFSRDTIRYKQYGPQQGLLVDLGYRQVFGGEQQTFNFEMRAYSELTRRSLVAWRTIYDHSDGDSPAFFALGGTNYLRGDFGYQEFVGSRRFLTQLELRFPLIDRLQFPGFGFSNIRGALFVDAGGTWFFDDQFNWEFQPTEADAEQAGFDPLNPDVNYLLGSVGFEVTLNFLGLELHWAWSKRTNFDTFPTGSLNSFWIGRKF
jgi:hypothetical protein